MTQTAKTPWRFSPWHIEEGPSAVYDANGDLVCTTSSDETAQMIAAAPDLLKALADAHRCLSVAVKHAGGDPDAHHVCNAASAAIARATGEKP